ncbi:MAG: TIGR00730 family Rossman fold protein [Chloroflexota bacterium]|nr:TIGR00730 family Rossman fold protein [Chloroflexota bacterium]
MADGYEINEMGKEESWRMFRIMGELVEGFDELSDIGPAVTIYGSARLEQTDSLYLEIEEIARRLGETGFAIITGGGPGAMEAANRGAFDAGATSIGLNIQLPMEQTINPYTTKSITFHHFFARKVMLVKYATAFIIMPGGWGTLDELSEVLTLIQTHKIKPFPVILFKSDYWDGFLEWMEHTVLARGSISREDMDLLRVCDDPDNVVEIVQSWYLRQELVGRKALRQ